jgi:hypothetical protein
MSTQIIRKAGHKLKCQASSGNIGSLCSSFLPSGLKSVTAIANWPWNLMPIGPSPVMWLDYCSTAAPHWPSNSLKSGVASLLMLWGLTKLLLLEQGDALLDSGTVALRQGFSCSPRSLSCSMHNKTRIRVSYSALHFFNAGMTQTGQIFPVKTHQTTLPGI